MWIMVAVQNVMFYLSLRYYYDAYFSFHTLLSCSSAILRDEQQGLFVKFRSSFSQFFTVWVELQDVGLQLYK